MPFIKRLLCCSLHFLVGVMRLVVFVVNVLTNGDRRVFGWIAVALACRQTLNHNV